MASYVVMESPDRADEVYVRDGFHFFAFLIPPLWLLWHRLWIEAALTFAVMAVLGVLATVNGIGEVAPVLSLIVSIYVGLEASAMQVAALRRRGWRDAGVVDADNAGEAEIRHVYAAKLADEPVAPEPALPLSAPGQPRPIAGPALGLLSYPGGR